MGASYFKSSSQVKNKHQKNMWDLAWARKGGVADKPLHVSPGATMGTPSELSTAASAFPVDLHLCLHSPDKNMPTAPYRQIHTFFKIVAFANATGSQMHAPLPKSHVHKCIGMCRKNTNACGFYTHIRTHRPTFVHTFAACRLKAECWIGCEDTAVGGFAWWDGGRKWNSLGELSLWPWALWETRQRENVPVTKCALVFQNRAWEGDGECPKKEQSCW